jgi:alpha-tubulin suppressor-like RCC1 family protein
MFGGFSNKINLKNHLLPYLYHSGDNASFASGDGLVLFYPNIKTVDENTSWSKIETNRFTFGNSNAVNFGIKNGELWTWGVNNFGQLGDGTTITRSSPVKIGNQSDWTDVATSGHHTLAIRSGALYAWGSGSSGNLGNNSTSSVSSPVRIGTDSDWFKISAGNSGYTLFSMGIRNVNVSPPNMGNLFAWGNGGFGQLGTSSVISRSSPTQVGIESDWIDVSCGAVHSIGIRHVSGEEAVGALYGWGQNSLYECGHTSVIENWTVDPNNQNYYWWWYWWWWNNYGPKISYPSSPVQVGAFNDWVFVKATSFKSIGVRNNDDLYYWGNAFETSIPTEPTFLSSGVVKAYIGQRNIAYIRDSSDSGNPGLYVLGQNNKGQLGNSTVQSGFITTPYLVENSGAYTEVSIGDAYVLSIKNNKIYGTGDNSRNLSLVDLNSSFIRNPLSRVDSSKNKFNYISTHDRSVFGIINGELWAWGSNEFGRLGINSSVTQSSPVRVGNETGWTQVQSCVGGGFTLAIKNGELYSWGNGGFGRRGSSNQLTVSSPVRVGTENTWTKVSASTAVGFAIREGKLFYFGLGSSSGLGTVGTVSSPVQIGALTDWTHISGGTFHALGIRDGKLYSWGRNTNGKLGTNEAVNVIRSSPVQVGTESGWTIAWAGYDHSVGIRDGKLFAWGRNALGALGDGTTVAKSSPVQIGTNSDWVWVYINTGSSLNDDSRHVVGIRNGELYTWGAGKSNDNIEGILGDGTSVNRSSPVKIGTFSDWIMACTNRDSTIAIR